MPDKTGAIHIGTSGWEYKHWKGIFYPEGLPAKDHFKYYQGQFKTVEINNTFYRLPAAQTFVNWHDAAPSDFVFAVKASRYITHIKRLKEPETLDRFMERAQGMKEKLGVILFQTPPMLPIRVERLEEFLKAFPKGHRATFEFRNPTWFNEEVYEILRRHNAALCMYEIAGKRSPEIVTADFIYIRLHGPDGAYAGSYDPAILKEWAKLIVQCQKEGKDSFCYFDNDEKAYAPKDARQLIECVKEIG